eukprot:7520030-Heterocapsa_arctica.AAC.1
MLLSTARLHEPLDLLPLREDSLHSGCADQLHGPLHMALIFRKGQGGKVPTPLLLSLLLPS